MKLIESSLEEPDRGRHGRPADRRIRRDEPAAAAAAIVSRHRAAADSVQTNWRAASPEEVESELLEPQEQVLQGLPGVEELDGNAGSGGSFINLTFAIGTDMKNALVDVIGRLNRVRSIPRDADGPVVQIGGGGNANESLSWFFVQLLPGTAGPIDNYRHFIENTIKPRIEAVPGVSQVIVNAGPPDEVRITVDIAKAAAIGVAIPDIARARPAPTTFPAARSRSAVSNTCCASPAATNPRSSASWCCRGATANRSSSAMSPRSN